MLEVLPPQASKGAGVAALLEHLGRDPRRALAIGDGENDVEMLELVARAGGVAVAMANARAPGLLAAANATTGTNDEDGAGAAFRRWCLEEGPGP